MAFEGLIMGEIRSPRIAQLERLQVRPDTLEFLRGKQIPTHVLETKDAVRLYNELREQLPTGGLFHSTC
jgi:hypothetical protein